MSEKVQNFLKDHKNTLYTIETERTGALFKATIRYNQKVVVTAHSDVIQSDSEVHQREIQAMERAVDLLGEPNKRNSPVIT